MIQTSYIGDTYKIHLKYISETEEINLTFYCQTVTNKKYT